MLDILTARVVMKLFLLLTEHFIDVPVPRILEEIVEVVRLVPQERDEEVRFCHRLWKTLPRSSKLYHRSNFRKGSVICELVSFKFVRLPTRFRVRSDVDSGNEEFWTQAHEL